MDYHWGEMNALLDVESDDVRFIGIWGMGGIGKTTIARYAYDKLSYQYDYDCFLGDVRQECESSGGRVIALQELLLSKAMKQTIRISSVHDGINLIRRWLGNKKVLVVLDDVDDQLKQLNDLAGSHDWFGPKSRIIVTTRDEQVLKSHAIKYLYKVGGLKLCDALQLFRMNAFKNKHPTDDHVNLSVHIVDYAHGLPLALKVLGSHLCDTTIEHWKSTLDSLKDYPDGKILKALRISYDHGLKQSEKEIFLNIACFFKGKKKDRVMEILDSCDLYSTSGIKVLIDKSLITISDCNELGMHGLLQEMGWEIVCEKCPNVCGKWSRLWLFKDVQHVLTGNTGTDEVIGIMLNKPKERILQLNGKSFSSMSNPMMLHKPNERLQLNGKSFSSMSNLMLLKLCNVNVSEDLIYLSNNLRFLKWHGSPLKTLPSNFQARNLFELNLCGSQINYLWKGMKDFPKLKTIKLSYSHNLIETPDFTMVPNLEMLDLEGCTRLRKVHDSVGFLKRLNILNLKGCKNLVSFPSNVSGLKLLKILNLQGCSKLDQLPQNLGELEVLEKLDAGETAIRQVPPSIARLSNLEILDLEGCTRLRKVHDSVGLLKRLTKLNLKGCKILVSLPSNVSGMKLLKILNLQGCSKLDQLPQNLEELEVLEELDVGETAIRQVPPSIARLSNLEYLSFCGCKVQGWRSLFLPRKYLNSMGLSLPRLSGLFSLKTLDLNDCRLSEESLPSDLGSLCSLKELRLSNNNFVSLPNSIKQLSKLQILCLENCRSLQSLPELPPKIIFVGAEDCISLEDVSNALSGGTSPNFVLHLLNCLKLHENLGQENNLAIKLLKEYLQQPVNLSSQFHIRLPGFDIPEWFSCKNDGNSVEIGLPPDWLNDDFMGIAMCGVFEPALENLDCIAEMGCTMSIMRNRFHFVFKIHSFTAVESHHLWLAYVSRVTLLSLYLNPPYDKVYGSDLVLVGDSTCIHAEFGIQYKKRTGDSDDVNDGCDGDGDDKKCKAIKCGIRLVYKQDKNYFQESSAAEGSVFHQKDKNHFLESELLSSAAELLSSAVYNHWRSLLKPGIDYYFNKRRYNRRYYSGWGLDSQSEVWERGLQIKNFLYSTKRTAVVLSTQRKTVNMELGTTEKTVFMSLIGHEKRLDVPKVGRGDYSDSDEE